MATTKRLINFPILDYRIFSVDHEYISLISQWNFLNTQSGFLKNFGSIKKYSTLPLENIPNHSSYFVDAKKAFKFINISKISFAKKIDVVFRRMYYDSDGIFNLSVGLKIVPKKKLENLNQISSILNSIFELKIEIQTGVNSTRKCKFEKLSDVIREKLLLSTTKNEDNFSFKPLLKPLPLSVICECDFEQIIRKSTKDLFWLKNHLVKEKRRMKETDIWLINSSESYNFRRKLRFSLRFLLQNYYAIQSLLANKKLYNNSRDFGKTILNRKIELFIKRENSESEFLQVLELVSSIKNIEFIKNNSNSFKQELNSKDVFEKEIMNIRNGNLEKAINLFLEKKNISKEKQIEFLSFSNQISNLNKEFRKGGLSSEDYLVSKNKLARNIIDYIFEIMES